MRKTILKEFLLYTTISTLIISFIFASLIYLYKINSVKKNMLFTLDILTENTANTTEDSLLEKIDLIEYLAEKQQLQFDILTEDTINLLDVSNSKISIEKNFTLLGKHIFNTYYPIQNTGYVLKLSSYTNTLSIYLSTTLLLFILNFSISIIYIKSLKKNIIIPLTNISKNSIKENQNKKYKFEEIESLNFYVKLNKNKLVKSINRLKIENKKIEYILDNMSEGFLLIDKNLKILTINKSAKKIFNCKEKAGKNILHYTQNIKIITPIENAIKEDKDTNFDISLKNKKIYSTYISKVKKENTKSYEYIVLMVDVTVERQNQRLKQELFSNISHELKTPITSIKGYTELLQNGFDSSEEQKQEFLLRIQRETYNITQLINDILTISNLQNKHQNLEVSPIKVNSLVEEISQSLLPICMEKNITIENNCDDITINADYKNFYKLFNNLILNAIKYNQKNGYVKVYFKEQNDYLELIVKDSGVGIPAEDKNRIFERFYRVEKGRSKSTGGSGLGLSIVKYIVKLYNGKIKVKSRLGNGSTFNIRFPKNKLL